MIADNTKRFTDRVDNYVKYRPGYPDEVITYLQTEGNLTDNAIIADIGWVHHGELESVHTSYNA